MLGFGLLNVYCRFLWFKPRFWEKCLRWIQAKEVRAMRIKRSLQRGPKYPKKGKNPRPKAKILEDQNAAHGKQNRAATTVGTTASPCWPPLPVVAATVRPWWGPRPWWSHFPRLCGFSARGVSFFSGFALFCLYISDTSGPLRPPNALPFRLPFS